MEDSNKRIEELHSENNKLSKVNNALCREIENIKEQIEIEKIQIQNENEFQLLLDKFEYDIDNLEKDLISNKNKFKVNKKIEEELEESLAKKFQIFINDSEKEDKLTLSNEYKNKKGTKYNNELFQLFVKQILPTLIKANEESKKNKFLLEEYFKYYKLAYKK